MDVPDFDIEEMDAYEREELEAMLYAQLHHVDPLPPEPPPEDPVAARISQLNTATTEPETHSSVTRGHGHSSPQTVGNEEEDATKSETAVDVCIPAVENTSAPTPGSTKPDGNVTAAFETDIQPLVEANDSEVPDQTKHPASSSSGTPSTIVRSPTQCPPTSVETPAITSNSQPPQGSAPVFSAAQLSRVPKRPLSPVLSDDEPETKTAALEADKRRRRRRRQPNGPITVHDSSSGSSTDEYVLEAGDDPPAACAPAPTTSGVVPSSAANPSGIMSAEVIALDKSSPTAPEVISLDGDSQSSSPKPSTSSVAAGTTAAVGQKTRQKLSAASRRARSLAGVETPESVRRRRPRPSSDLSSSDDSDGGGGGGAAPADDCDIRMNVRGAGPTAAAAAAAGRPDWTLADETAGARTAVPVPAWRRAMASTRLTEADRQLLEPLCRSQPCHKWSPRQRAGYTTPKDYGPQDVGSIQTTMSDDGWDIPAEYLTRSAGGRTAKARYYSNMTRNRCRRCDEVGHLVADCSLPPTCYLCGEEGHSGDGRCHNMICFMCGGRSHPTDRCPRHVRPVFCALCMAAGHTSEECPDRWRRFHATTSSGPAVQPPRSLENRPSSGVHCWQCGQRGHYGHHCRDERYTSMASLSQQVISYTETACASRDVSGIVANPAQMDAVFAPRRRRRLERETGASLTYEQLGDNSWLINISGDLEAARSAHDHVQAILLGKKRPRPRPSSAPASPVHLTDIEGITSAPVSPEPARPSNKAIREMTRQQKKARLAERRARRRQAREAAARPNPPPPLVVDLDSRSGDGCAEASSEEEVTVLDEVPRPAPAAAEVGVETVTLESDGEQHPSDGCRPRSARNVLTEAGRGSHLGLLQDTDGQRPEYAGDVAKLSKKQRKRLRKKMRKDMATGAVDVV